MTAGGEGPSELKALGWALKNMIEVLAYYSKAEISPLHIKERRV